MDIEKYLTEQSKGINHEIEKIVPHTIDGKWVEKVFGKASYAYDVESIQKSIADPIWNLLDRGGKRWRPVLFLLSLEAVGGDVNKYKHYSAIFEMVHNGTLMIDDIEDSSDLRRGQPCTHKVYGVDVAINAGNAMYYLPYTLIRDAKELSPEKRMALADIYGQEMLNVHIGQGMDILWHRGQKYSISEDEYLQMCAYKTGTLARMAARAGALLGGGSIEQQKALGKFSETIGVAFQIQDDLLNLAGEEFAKGKGVGEDIHEGKRTIMVLHTLNKANEKDKKRLLDILNSHPSDEKTIREAIAIIEKHGSMDYARKKAKELVEKSWKDVEKVLPESEAKNTLRAFAEFLINRKV